jgi:hypothetical protein
LWTNSFFERALETKTIPLELDTKEIQQNKVNPSR